MASFNFVSNAVYNPFTYDELIKPVLMATQAHQQLEDEYSLIKTKAGIWERLAGSEKDRDLYNQYKAFEDDLQASVDDLNARGLNSRSRQGMLNMRTRYMQEIQPMNEAWDERERQIKVQQEMMIKDPTHRFRYNAADTPLSQFMGTDKIDTLAANFSGATIQAQVENAMSSIREGFKRKGALTGIGLPFQYEQAVQQGATLEDIMGIMNANGDTKSLNTIQRAIMGAVNQVMDASGVRGWDNPALEQYAMNNALLGIRKAVGPASSEKYTDNYSASIAEYRAKKNIDLKYESLKNELASQGIDPYAELGYRSGYYIADSDTYISNPENILQDLTLGKDRGINPKYGVFENGKKVAKNPMKMYEEMQKYYDSIGANRFEPSGSAGAWPSIATLSRNSSNLAPYSPSQIISKDTYNFLKGLGLTSKSSVTAFYAPALRNRIDTTATKYRARTVNLANYDRISDEVATRINSDRNAAVYEYDSGKKGKSIEASKLFDDKNKLKVSDIAVDINYMDKGLVIAQINGKDYLISANLVNGLGNDIILNNNVELMKRIAAIEHASDMSEEEKRQNILSYKDHFQSNAALELRNALNNFGKIRSTTDSNI